MLCQRPPGQALHEPSPLREPNRPAWHLVHVDAPLGAKRPRGHVKQLVAVTTVPVVYRPAGHVEQDEPATYLPERQPQWEEPALETRPPQDLQLVERCMLLFW